MPVPPHGDLLIRYEPIVRFDSSERWFPCSVAAWTDAPGHELRRADATVIASDRTDPPLAVGLLGPDRYADGQPVKPGDAIAALRDGDHLAAVRDLYDQPPYAGSVYGRAQVGSDGRLWLQYRWFYVLNDYRLLGRWIPVGVHEGDWEMVQLRMDGTRPDLALYLHHRRITAHVWNDVERAGDRPVVYVARGSHGCYASAGRHWTGAWFDRADGRIRDRPQRLEIVDDRDPVWAWMHWPGAWGGTLPRRRPLGWLDGQSPAGPGARIHVRWRDPAVLLARAEPQSAVRRRAPE